MKKILLIPHIKIQNANALSSPYTIGFPAMTAWLGGVHALARKLNQSGFGELKFNSVAVCCHSMNLHIYRGDGDFEYSIIGTGNPLDKDGERCSFIEEARCHLEISLIIDYEGVSLDHMDEFLEKVYLLTTQIKLAGGDILSFQDLETLKVLEEKDLRKLIRKLMPGYLLIERQDLMLEAMQHGEDAINAMLAYLKVMHRSEQNEIGSSTWSVKRKAPGWIVPIAVGFQGISVLSKAENQRDQTTPHRFAESVVTLGEFIMPYRIENLDNVLWHYRTDLENDLYLCQQNRPINSI